VTTVIEAPQTPPARRLSPATWLIICGGVVVVVGAMAGLAAKRCADIASYIASQPKRLIGPQIVSSKEMSGPTFDPSSTHYVAPDYTLFWVCMLVVVVGLMTVAGAIILRRPRR
jgi:hypothetical protein